MQAGPKGRSFAQQVPAPGWKRRAPGRPPEAAHAPYSSPVGRPGCDHRPAGSNHVLPRGSATGSFHKAQPASPSTQWLQQRDGRRFASWFQPSTIEADCGDPHHSSILKRVETRHTTLRHTPPHESLTPESTHRSQSALHWQTTMNAGDRTGEGRDCPHLR
jgi:hypothetical protein